MCAESTVAQGWGMACAEVLGALQRLTENDLSGDVGHAGDGGHGTHVARLSDGSGFSAMPDGAELRVCHAPAH